MSKKLIPLILLFICTLSQANDVTWKVTFDENYQLPLVKLNIQGKNLTLILDTSSKQALYLPIEIINKIPNKIENPKKIQVNNLFGNTQQIRTFMVSDLTLNAFNVKNITVAEYKPWDLIFSNDDTDSNDHIDIPIIGLDLFHHSILTLNFPKNQITISNEDNALNSIDATWVSLPFKLSKEGIVINASDGIKNYNLILDSAASSSLIKEQSIPSITTKDDDLDLDYQIIDLNIKNLKTESVKAIAVDAFPPEFQSDGLLGIDFLINYIVKINFKTKQLWIKAAEG